MADTSPKAFLGKGWNFPAAPDDFGAIAMALYEEDVRQAVRIILGTSPGERVMRPDFGAGLRDLVFSPINATTMALTRNRVEKALVEWEPRIDTVTVQVSATLERGQLRIEINYRLRATNTFYNLVYPFYLYEGKRP
jgi:phage baseplate assembly protein W